MTIEQDLDVTPQEAEAGKRALSPDSGPVAPPVARPRPVPTPAVVTSSTPVQQNTNEINVINDAGWADEHTQNQNVIGPTNGKVGTPPPRRTGPRRGTADRTAVQKYSADLAPEQEALVAGAVEGAPATQTEVRLAGSGVTATPLDLNLLATGPDSTLFMRSNVSPGVDGSNALLRKLSPFMIRLEPPLVYGEGNGYMNRTAGSITINRISRAAADGYGASRSALSAARDTSGFIKETPVKMGSPSIADLQSALDQKAQLDTVLSTPPLVLLINPTSLTLTLTKIQQMSDRTRYGLLYQLWGEEQPSLSISARCGAFYSGGRGVHILSREDSPAWQNLMSLFQIFKNNGYIYDTVGGSNAHLMVGCVSLHYDQWVYYGHFESFNFTLDTTNQLGGVTFEMDFKVSALQDLSHTGSVIRPMSSPMPGMQVPQDAYPLETPEMQVAFQETAEALGVSLESYSRPVSQVTVDESEPFGGTP